MNLKNKVLKDITIEGIAAAGKCIARYDGQVVFVTGVAPGDVADIKIIRRKKSFLEAIPLEIKSYSDKRQEPFCEHFGVCGGCKWQHIDYQGQVGYKQQEVADQLQRIGKVTFPQISPVIPSSETRYYRNKLEFTFTEKRWLTKKEIASGEEVNKNGLGFHIPGRFDKILDINHCYLQPDPSNAIRLAVKAYAMEKGLSFYNMVKQAGFLRNLIIRTASTGQVMVILQVAENRIEETEKLLDHLAEKFPGITCLHYVINKKGNEIFHDLEVVDYKGPGYIVEEMADPKTGNIIQFRVGPKSFYQTNASQAEALYYQAWKMADLKGDELLYDLYTGTGTIASYMASSAKKVIGIEYIEAAIEDAKVNAEINGITNTAFYSGDMKDLLTDEFIATHGRPDVIITDPPRAGMHADVCRVILNAAPDKIVYVSCNPATQARDLALLDKKYKIVNVQPVDMFPHTHHVENIVSLRLRN